MVKEYNQKAHEELLKEIGEYRKEYYKQAHNLVTAYSAHKQDESYDKCDEITKLCSVLWNKINELKEKEEREFLIYIK